MTLLALFTGTMAWAAEPPQTGPSFDCTKATGKVATHVFPAAGTYSVTVSVKVGG
jgi:uncharacterized protein